MYDDYGIEYSPLDYESCYDLNEDYMDEDNDRRESQDYETLAYQHYA
jgi:hypothetical protein